MKKVVNVSINGFANRSDAEEFAVSCNFDMNSGKFLNAIKSWYWSISVDVDDRRMERLLRRATSRGLIVESAFHVEFSDEEKDAASFLNVYFATNRKVSLSFESGTRYDLRDACRECWSGATAIPPAKIESGDLPRSSSFAETIEPIPLVGGALRDELAKIAGSERWLLSVSDRKSDKLIQWSAIMPRTILPKLDGRSTGLSRFQPKGRTELYCQTCCRDSWTTSGAPGFVPVLSRKAVWDSCRADIRAGESMPDAAASWELLGPGAKPGLAKQIAPPLVFVNQAIYRILKTHVKGKLGAVPVQFVE